MLDRITASSKKCIYKNMKSKLKFLQLQTFVRNIEGENIPKLNLRKFMLPGNLSLNYINSDSTMSTPTRCVPERLKVLDILSCSSHFCK